MSHTELNTIPYYEPDDNELPEGIPPAYPRIAPVCGLHWEDEYFYHQPNVSLAERL